MNAIACAPDDVCLGLGQFKFDWEKHRANVKKLHMRIVKPQQEGRHNKVKVLQRLLKHSFSTKRKNALKENVDEARWEMPSMQG